MKKVRETIIAWLIVLTSISLATGIGYLIAVSVYEPKVNKLENEVQTQYYYIGQLERDIEWLDEIIDVVEEIARLEAKIEWLENLEDYYDEIYERDVEIARLEAKVAFLENMYLPSEEYYSDDYVNQILEDFDDAIEIIIHYYENTDQVVDLVTYIEINYPALYARLLSYA